MVNGNQYKCIHHSSEALGEDINPDTPAEHLWSIADRLDVEIPRDRGYGHGKLIEELWEHTVGKTLWAPTFVRDFPVETTPLTRAHRSIKGVTEKWDLYIRRVELATGYSELIDPGHPTRKVRGTSARGGRWRRRGNGPGRGLPGRPGVCDAALDRDWNGYRQIVDGFDGTRRFGRRFCSRLFVVMARDLSRTRQISDSVEWAVLMWHIGVESESCLIITVLPRRAE